MKHKVNLRLFISIILGSCEVSSCICKYLKVKNEEGFKVINFFADRCGGQNCNRMILNMMCEAMKMFGFDSLSLNFLVSGHSQNENDTAHSVIEAACRNKTIYTTNQWEISIQMAFKKNVCKVVRVFHRDIINYKSPIAFPQFTSVLKDSVLEMVEADNSKGEQKGKKAKKSKGIKVYWSKIMQVKFTKEHPNKMFFKYSYDEEKFHEIEYRDDVSRRQAKKTDKNACKLYTESPGIGAKKKADLLELCRKKLIPEQHHGFFRDLKTSK